MPTTTIEKIECPRCKATWEVVNRTGPMPKEQALHRVRVTSGSYLEKIFTKADWCYRCMVELHLIEPPSPKPDAPHDPDPPTPAPEPPTLEELIREIVRDCIEEEA